MHTTIPIEGSSERDAAAHAREAGGNGVAKDDIPDSAVVPETASAAAATEPARKLRRECASIDIRVLAICQIQTIREDHCNIRSSAAGGRDEVS